MPTMKELREDCARRGITPGRGIEETLRRIHAHMSENAKPPAEELCQDEGCPQHGTPHVCVSNDLTNALAGVVDMGVDLAAGPDMTVVQVTNAAGHYDVAPDQMPTDELRRNVAHLAPAAKDKAAQHRLARKQMRKATQRAQRRRAA